MSKPYGEIEIQRKQFLQVETSKATGIPSKIIDNILDRCEFPKELGFASLLSGKGQKRLFSAADAAHLTVIHQLSGPLGYKEAEKAALYLSHYIDGTAPLQEFAGLIIQPMSPANLPPPRLRTKWDSEAYHFYTMTPYSTSDDKARPDAYRIVFPHGPIIHALWDRLYAAYDLTPIEKPEEFDSWKKARFVDPNAEEGPEGPGHSAM
jgi:hypothetical protein